MSNSKRLLVILLILVLIIAGAFVLYSRMSNGLSAEQLSISAEAVENDTVAAPEDSKPQNEEESIAPDFKIYDADGNELRLHDFFGKPIVLNFWASWCGPCQMEMPDFDEAYKEYGEEIHFLMVNMTDGGRETLESAMSFIEESGYSFPVYYDTEQDAAYTYGVYSLPTTYFIDAEGNGIAQARGAIDAATLQTGIDMIIK